ncbi:MAG: UDP-N-acetylglucosamine 2-epimerase (non-hydrolyzing) [Candidatus Heimdallarchaeota archaeon]|nr:MAG: UDP-N-acetylglucosamine 2-epimerase (non-hydrolyzing) [Candidatus Heimdallarchaeota archaeon]
MVKKYALVTGTRPQIIKSVPLIKNVETLTEIEIVHIFTGQHYDSYLSDVFFKNLLMDSPDYELDVRSGSTDYHIRMILKKLIPILKKENYDGLLIPGDTNSALAGALAGMFLKIPVCHIEAGLRSFDLMMQEEINRRLIDHGSALLFTPTKMAIQNLEKESVLGTIMFTGDTMQELLISEKEAIIDRKIFESAAENLGIEKKDYLIMTLHRRETLNDSEKLNEIFLTIGETGITSIFPIHPHTRKIIEKSKIELPSSIRLIDPQSYHNFLNLVVNSKLVLTDSGGLQKEAYLLEVPCVTLRNKTEWLETVEEGANKIVGNNPELIAQAIEEMINKKIAAKYSIYGDGKASKRILKELSKTIPRIPTVREL